MNKENKECCKDDHSTKHEHSHTHDHAEDHNHSVSYLNTVACLVLLFTAIALDYFKAPIFTGYLRLSVYVLAYLLTGGKVIMHAVKSIGKGDVFNEFFLMTIATLGAFYIREYAEGVAVMLFYVIGEHFQEAAVKRSRKSIKALIDNRPERVMMLKDGILQDTDPSLVKVGSTIQIKAGEKVALDGTMVSDSASFNTSALTGESKPDTKYKGEQILAGMINLEKVVDLKVSSSYENSALSKVLKLVEEAGTRKSKTQLFISRFAKIYTPAVVYMALAIVILPFFFTDTYVFNEWLYKALIFLVISCPCALVISIPLGYFGGIGAASKNGILFKGANFLDLIITVDTVVMDKTGTLTKGVFKVHNINSFFMDKSAFLNITAALESKSNHPVAIAISDAARHNVNPATVDEVKEIPGHGIIGKVNGKMVIAGNKKLLSQYKIQIEGQEESVDHTIVHVAIDGIYSGWISISDEIKEDAADTIRSLLNNGVKNVMMLSGDKQSVVDEVAKKTGILTAFGNLLPQDKVNKIESLKRNGHIVAFVGDGINDAPAITLSDVGIAMGGLGSDAAIETADVVIQNDQPSKIVTAIRIGRATKKVVWQNIILSFGVKLLVLVAGTFGVASLWEAVFADVGVALLAILNAVRIQRIKF